ncbi:MAG: amidohydrolase family protein [Dehalococcoidia bacterium]
MKRVDVHAHYIPESCLDLLQGSGPPHSSLVGDMTDLEKRVQDMDAMGVDIQAISSWPSLLNMDLAMTRRMNDGIAKAVRLHPDRFVGLAAVHMNHPEEAVAELERAVKELSMRGLEIATNVGGKNLDAKEFAPFYAKVQELDMPVFIHPIGVLGQDRLGSHYLSNLLGNPTDTAVAVASLIFGGVLKEFPRLRFYLAHGGGTCPYVRGRWEHGWRVRPEIKAELERPPSEYFKLFYFDSLLHSVPALNYLVETVGPERVMLGTDYPFDMGEYDAVNSITSLPHLSDAQKEQILGGNAIALFRIEA